MSAQSTASLRSFLKYVSMSCIVVAPNTISLPYPTRGRRAPLHFGSFFGWVKIWCRFQVTRTFRSEHLAFGGKLAGRNLRHRHQRSLAVRCHQARAADRRDPRPSRRRREDRYGRRSTIVTSQLPVDQWHADRRSQPSLIGRPMAALRAGACATGDGSVSVIASISSSVLGPAASSWPSLCQAGRRRRRLGCPSPRRPAARARRAPGDRRLAPLGPSQAFQAL
jgi:hypothetical protein